MSEARCPPEAGIHQRPAISLNCGCQVRMGVLVEAGGGYRAQPIAMYPRPEHQLSIDKHSPLRGGPPNVMSTYGFSLWRAVNSC
jgi:hypothetical protein